jgi:pimeloyl-ACP methyl ester carboxylesterase
MNQLMSRDGTRIAFERTGDGPALILVVGAFNDRTKGAPLARALAHRFRVCTYDRRGHGDSTDAEEYDIAREIEDLAALIAALGGSAALFGYSSGAALALRAAASELPITKLALYELPPAQSPEHAAELRRLVAAGRRGDAVEYFQRQVVGIPEQVVNQLRHAPFRPALEAMAHTLVYDATLVAYGAPSELAHNVRQPTLALAGAASFPAMRAVAEALVAALPHARSLTLEGQTHEIEPAVLGPLIEQFLVAG